MFVPDNHCTPSSKRSVFSALSHRPSLRVPAALNCAKCQRAILCCQLWPSAHTCAVDFKLPASTPLGPICMSSYSWFTRRKQQADVAHCVPFRMATACRSSSNLSDHPHFIPRSSPERRTMFNAPTLRGSLAFLHRPQVPVLKELW